MTIQPHDTSKSAHPTWKDIELVMKIQTMG